MGFTAQNTGTFSLQNEESACEISADFAKRKIEKKSSYLRLLLGATHYIRLQALLSSVARSTKVTIDG